ncbi:MAG TPA: carboxypeptidase M32 [Tetragenococcus sp.]|nr:carboxypeptidase M32 [Tetragenococcus sp.]
MKQADFLQELKEIDLLKQSLALLEWDSSTGMPTAANTYRSEVAGFLSGKCFEKETGPIIKEAIKTFSLDSDQLSEVSQAALNIVKEEYEKNQAIPNELMVKRAKANSRANAAWQRARKENNFSLFADALADNIQITKELIAYWKKDEKTAYDVLLNNYEPDMTTAVLDDVFSQLADGITKIRKTLKNKGTEPRTDFLKRYVAVSQQKKFIYPLLAELGYDFTRGRIDDTIHPFALGINHNDVRLTNRWNENDFIQGVLGLVHEAGHGTYEQNIAQKYEYTPVHKGASMGIHESQSLFNELVIASRRAFWQKQYPILQTYTADTFKDIPFADFYRSLKHSKASLIRIEADSLTYVLHIIIRYEIEKLIFNGEVEVADLPQIWNDKYEEYLGIRPTNDLEGILQDVHWSQGDFGYFPSYALGYMYACQLYYAMQEEINVDGVLASSDYSPITNWLIKHIHQYGASKKPNELILAATGEKLNPKYLLAYLEEIYFDVYQVEK